MKRIVTVLLSMLLVSLSAAFAVAQNDMPREISGGVVNGKAVELPKPIYSDEAKAAGIEGLVQVNVLIDESGTVISADVFGGRAVRMRKSPDGKPETFEMEEVNPLLADAARQAAMAARFSPTLLNGVPVRVRGTIIYNFVANEKPAAEMRGTGISGGVLNGKAISLPAPAFPAAARAVRASGAVSVRVVVDESGEVISAEAVSGHPLLRAAAVEAARAAKFSRVILSGEPVKVTGVIVYNFAAPDDGTDK